jgi:uncharacterized protein
MASFHFGAETMPSLQDQLLKAGLINDKQAKQANKEKRKQDKQTRRSSEPVVDEVKQSIQNARAEKAERDRQLNLQREQELQEKAIAAQIRQLIENHRQPKDAGQGEVEYNFTDRKVIKKLRVSPAVQQQIVRGQLAIVKLGEGYELVPRVVAEKIALRDQQVVLVANAPSTGQQADDDDPYKDYVIPDDLMW